MTLLADNRPFLSRGHGRNVNHQLPRSGLSAPVIVARGNSDELQDARERHTLTDAALDSFGIRRDLAARVILDVHGRSSSWRLVRGLVLRWALPVG